MNELDARSSFLFPDPSPLDGFARTLDIGSTYDRFNTSRSAVEADAVAIYNDWAAVGEDLYRSMAQVVRGNGQLSLFEDQ